MRAGLLLGPTSPLLPLEFPQSLVTEDTVIEGKGQLITGCNRKRNLIEGCLRDEDQDCREECAEVPQLTWVQGGWGHLCPVTAEKLNSGCPHPSPLPSNLPSTCTGINLEAAIRTSCSPQSLPATPLLFLLLLELLP